MSGKVKQAGFTLVEILVVIGVIGILLGIAVPAYNKYVQKGKTAEAMSDLKRIETAIIALATDTGWWPHRPGKPPQAIGEINGGMSNEVYDLSLPAAGLVATDGSYGANWNGPYLPEVPLDPWGNPYFFDTDYQIGGVDFIVLGSYGTGSVCQNCYNDTDVRLILPQK